MIVGTRYKKEKAKTSYDTIIVGSGIGGLALGSLLAQDGQSVCILEKHYTAGGFTHVFTRKGFEWDVGIHYIGEVHRKNSILRKVFDDVTKGQLKWAPMPELYDKVIIKDKQFNLLAGSENFKKELKEKFPNDHKAIDDYVNLIYKVAGYARGFFGLKAMPLFLAKILSPFLARKFYRYSDKTTKEVLEGITKNQELIGVLTAQYGDYGLPPKESSFVIHAMVAKHYMSGGSYPVGGSAQIAATILPIIESAGGHIFTHAGVKEVLIKDNKAYGVELENGDQILAKDVVSSIGVPNTFNKIIPKEVQKKHELNKLASKIKPSLAHICLYIGLNKTAEELNLDPANFWIYPDYDHDENIKKFLEDPDKEELPVTYISFPSAKDPEFSKKYPGKGTIEVISFTPFEWFEKWADTKWRRRGEDYEAYKEKFAKRMLDKLFQHVPQVKEHIEYYEISTPLSTKTFCYYDHGEIYGLNHTPERFRQDWLRPKTPVKHFYLTGQDIVTVGIGGALFSSLVTASVLKKKNVVKEVIQRQQ